jgi:predicted ribosome quality control (RQC) complex YloA/Tae2 family protein
MGGLQGGHVQRITAGRVTGRAVALVQVRVPGETVHVVVVERAGAGAGVGAGGGAGAQVGLIDKEGRARLRAAMQAVAPVGEARARAIGEQVRAGLAGASREELEARGARLVASLASAGAAGRREALRKALARAMARVDRRIEAVRGDLARAESAGATAQRAQLFVAAAASAPRGATKLVAVDWSSGEAREVELPLDPARGAREQIDAIFRRARRLELGARIARARLADAQKARAALAAAAQALTDADDAQLEALEAQAHAAAPRDFRRTLAASTPGAAPGAAPAGARSSAARGPRRAAAARPPYRVFVGASGARILVGRGAEENDELTLHVARPHDLWLHAKNRAGAHVVVPLDKNAGCPPELLVEAAHLAAHFSEARGERVVEVQYTPRRYVRKPRGSAPGLVVVDREKVLVLRREDETLRTLLDREQDG